MNKKKCLESFNTDIDKIVLYEQSNFLCGDDSYNEEYKEVILVAQLLAKADYSTEARNCMEKVTKKVSNAKKENELDDDELDMVAGGLTKLILEVKKK